MRMRSAEGREPHFAYDPPSTREKGLRLSSVGITRGDEFSGERGRWRGESRILHTTRPPPVKRIATLQRRDHAW
eukprot:4631876-Pyramimonas_sp.AAC.1